MFLFVYPRGGEIRREFPHLPVQWAATVWNTMNLARNSIWVSRMGWQGTQWLESTLLPPRPALAAAGVGQSCVRHSDTGINCSAKCPSHHVYFLRFQGSICTIYVVRSKSKDCNYVWGYKCGYVLPDKRLCDSNRWQWTWSRAWDLNKQVVWFFTLLILKLHFKIIIIKLRKIWNV